jgi:hypothetical protein
MSSVISKNLLFLGTCNPSYSGGRDQEDLQFKAWANSSQDSVSKMPIKKKRASGVAQGVDPEFKPQYHPKTIIL